MTERKPVYDRLVNGLAVVFAASHLRRTGLIAAAVGTWLTLFNQIDVLLAGAWSTTLAVKVALNYVTPFVVANLGLLSRQSHPIAGGVGGFALGGQPSLQNEHDN